MIPGRAPVDLFECANTRLSFCIAANVKVSLTRSNAKSQALLPPAQSTEKVALAVEESVCEELETISVAQNLV